MWGLPAAPSIVTVTGTNRRTLKALLEAISLSRYNYHYLLCTGRDRSANQRIFLISAEVEIVLNSGISLDFCSELSSKSNLLIENCTSPISEVFYCHHLWYISISSSLSCGRNIFGVGPIWVQRESTKHWYGCGHVKDESDVNSYL